MPLPFLRDRRDPSRVYFYTELMARNPYLEESNEPPEHLAHDRSAIAKATDRAARLNVDPKKMEDLRDGHALMLQSNNNQSDKKVARDINKRAERRKTLLASAPSSVVDESLGVGQNVPASMEPFQLPTAQLPPG